MADAVSRPGAVSPPAWMPIVAIIVLAAAVFALSAAIGGVTWDEVIHRNGAELQFEVAAGWLAGEPTTFRSLPSDYAFYGIIPTGLVTGIDALWTAITGDPLPTRAFGIWLHAITFVLSCLSVFLVFDILRRQSRHRWMPWLGAAFLLLYPPWLGYGLMDYKDVPTAFFLLLLVYCTARALEGNGEGLVRWTVFAALATIALGGTKAAALALGVVPWLALAIAAFRQRRWALPFLAAVGIVLGLIVVTPVSWPEPVAFFTAAVELMSRHPWRGCTLTNGACLGPSHDDWSAAGYLWQWARVQMPLVVIIGILPAMAVALWRGGVGRIAAGTLAFTIGAIVVRNASLYDGLRHVLFVVPLIVIVMFVAIDYAIAAWGRVARVSILALVGIEMASFAIDDVRLFPYNYAYFNLAARSDIDIARFETEFWGFSLHEAVAAVRPPEGRLGQVVGNPAHIVAASLPRRKVFWLNHLRGSGYTGPYTEISYTRGGLRPPESCETIAEVSRALLGGPRLLFSYAARCTME